MEWIPVEKGTPQIGMAVLICFSGKIGSLRFHHSYAVADLLSDGWQLDGHKDVTEFTVHAWAEIPIYDPEKGDGKC